MKIRNGEGNFSRRLLLVLLMVVCPVITLAAPSLDIYGKLPGFEMAALSDSGEHIALIGVVKDERRLIVIDKENHAVINTPLGDIKVRGLYWAGDQSVLIRKSDTKGLSPFDFTTDLTELSSVIVVPLNGGKPWSVFAKSSTITGGVSGFYGICERDGRFYGYFGGITFDGGTPTIQFLQSTSPVLYEVDLQNQKVHKVAPRMEGKGVRQWVVGLDGEISATLDFYKTNGDWEIRNREGEKIVTGIQPLGKVRLAGLGITPGTVAYAIVNEEGEEHWFELPLAGGEVKPILEGVNPKYVYFNEKTRQITGYKHDTDIPAYTFFDARRQKVINGTMKAFPSKSAQLQDSNSTFDKLIVMTEGVADPQTWWLVDIKTGKANVLGFSYPMPAKDVAPMSMMHYKAGDGLDIAAVLTLPPGVVAKNLPVIVMPHGGPHARDYPGFNWWVQAFASRGYAVLQPNFRGSTGYGAAFEEAGNGEWGRRMQTDLSDGLAYLVQQGIVDPKRACIVGASYGGYAALAGVTLQKGIYRCAVAVAGIGDPVKMVNTDLSKSGYNPTLRRALQRELGKTKDLRTVSPISFVDAAEAPILLIHGKNDIVVRYEQSADMANALRKAGKQVELVTLEGEDHWLSKSSTRLAMLKAAMEFVEKYNPAIQIR